MASPPDRGPQQLHHGPGRLWLPPVTSVSRPWGWLPPGTVDLGTLSQPNPLLFPGPLCPIRLGQRVARVLSLRALADVVGLAGDGGVKGVTSAPPQPLGEWHRPGRGSTVGGVSPALQAPRGADVSVCPGGLPSVSPQATWPLGPPVGTGQGYGAGQPGAQFHPLSSSRLGYNALGDPTALGLARGLPRHLRVLQ